MTYRIPHLSKTNFATEPHIVRATSELTREVSGTLCCGFAGQGFALLSYHRLFGCASVLRDAGDLCCRAVALANASDSQDSLFHGKIGVALLDETLRRPELSAMPIVEAEGWNDQV